MKLKIVSAAVILAASLSMSAQTTLNSTYFLDGNTSRHNLNPAFACEKGYVTFPGLGNVTVGLNGNIGTDAIMQKVNGDYVSFLDSSISYEDAMSEFEKNNKMELNLGVEIFTIGFKAFGGFNTIGLNIKSSTGFYMPDDVFAFLKTATNFDPMDQLLNPQEYNYHMKDVVASTNNYLEVAFGHSRKLNEQWAVGAAVKLNLGALYANVEIDHMDVELHNDRWMISQKSKMYGSKGLEPAYNENGALDFDDMDFDDFGLAGFGLGLDLGAVYNPSWCKELTLSASVTDLGFISWRDGFTASNDGDEFEFQPESYIDGYLHGMDASDAAEDLFDELEGLVNVYDEDKSTKTTSLSSTVRLGAEYAILKNKISFGGLFTSRIGGPQVWNEFMLSSNFRPCKWFNASINGSFSNTRCSMGMALNIHAKAVNFFVGSDYFLASFDGYLPAKCNVSTGLSFNF